MRYAVGLIASEIPSRRARGCRGVLPLGCAGGDAITSQSTSVSSPGQCSGGTVRIGDYSNETERLFFLSDGRFLPGERTPGAAAGGIHWGQSCAVPWRPLGGL